LAAPVAQRVPDVGAIQAKASGPHNPLLCHKINKTDLLKKLAVRGITNCLPLRLLNGELPTAEWHIACPLVLPPSPRKESTAK
jgi:hypothetical protein